jgi:hypothetical protein
LKKEKIHLEQKKTNESKRKETPKSPLEEAKADLVRDGFMGHSLRCFHETHYHAFMTNSFFQHHRKQTKQVDYAPDEKLCKMHPIERRRLEHKKIKIRHMI